MKIALVHLRKAGKVTISGYLDDNIIVNFGDNVLAIKKGVFTADILQDFGFTINVPKSVFNVVSIIEHLGFAINSVDMLVTMTVDKTGTMTLVDKPLAKPRKRQRQSTAGKDAFIDLADDELPDILPYIIKRARPSLGELGRSVYFATQHDKKYVRWESTLSSLKKYREPNVSPDYMKLSPSFLFVRDNIPLQNRWNAIITEAQQNLLSLSISEADQQRVTQKAEIANLRENLRTTFDSTKE